MTSYVIDAILEVTITFREIHLEKIAEKILQLTAEMRRKPHLYNIADERGF